MKRFGKWFGSSLLIVASIFMLTSILSCGSKKKNNGGATAAAKFKITFKADPADAGTVTAMVDGKAITSGAEVEKDKKVVFTLAIKDATKHELDKWDVATAKKDNALMAELTVAKAVEVVAKLKAKGSADPALTFKSMKIVEKDVAKATDGKLSVVLPAGTTKVEQTNIKEAKFMAGTKEVTDATVTLVGAPVTIDAKTQKADLKVKVAAKAGSYAETEFTIAATVEQPPIVLKDVKYAVKLANADAKDKCSVKIYVGEKAAGATTSTFKRDEDHELKPLPPAAGADAGKLKTTVGTDLLFVVSFATTQNYRVKDWTGVTTTTITTDKSEAQATVGDAGVDVTITLEDKPTELKATALKLVDKDRTTNTINWIAYDFSDELTKGFNPADSAIPEIKLDKDAWNGKKLKFVPTFDTADNTATTEVYDGTTKVEDTTGLKITETAKTIKLVVQKKESNVVKKEGVYKFKIVLAEVAKLSKIELKKDTNAGQSIEVLSKAKFEKLCGGLEYVYLVDSNISKVAVVATAADGATVTYKYGGADCNGECTLDATKTCEISVIKKEGETVKKAKKVYRIKFVKAGDKQNKHHIKNVKICDQAITWDDLDEAENAGANGTKIAHIVLPKSVENDLTTKNKFVWENSANECGKVMISLKKKGDVSFSAEEDKTSEAGATKGVVIDSDKAKYPCEIKVVVKKEAGSTAETDVTTYIFHVSIAAN